MQEGGLIFSRKEETHLLVEDSPNLFLSAKKVFLQILLKCVHEKVGNA